MPNRRMTLLKLCCLFAACLLATGCIHVHQLPHYEHYHVPPAPIAIIVSGDLDDYRELTDALASQMVRTYTLFALEAQLAAGIEKSIWAMQPSTIVAIGQPALELASRLAVTDIVYAQVFNPPAQHRGVNPIPPFDMQLSRWMQVSPQLQRIGVVGSAEMHDLIDELDAASHKFGLELIRREVTSDKEALQAFRAMVPQIDGFVFLPDEDVLSPYVIKRVITHGARNDRQILVYSPVMFQLGADLYVGAQQADIAEQIVVLLDDPAIRTRSLTKMLMKVRGEVPTREQG
ncbi:MAG: ABC transporter substrate binding protein [Gammaproteobacteria bacterium]|nr:ABC transporter substrate binding protein [Gammaproteobacteria bacterium]